MDVALAVVIFIIAFFIVYSIVTNKTSGDVSDLYEEAERISKEAVLQNSTISLVNGESLNETKIKNVLGQDYSELKRKLRVNNEFCIYFEDENGNLIVFQNSSDDNASGIGSQSINISGIVCS